MTKEKFTYELIDKWLYLVGQQCVLMENYTQKDRTFIYEECSRELENCLDYYDQLYAKVDHKLHSEEEIDARLGFIIQKLRNETIKNMMLEMETELCIHLCDKKEFITEHLFSDNDGKKQEITKKTLVHFMHKLRMTEEALWKSEGESYGK